MSSLNKKTTPEFHPKGWGAEHWICNSEKYCGKILVFNKGKKCSWHYHVIKDEVFYLQKGQLLVEFSEKDDLTKAEAIVLHPGESFHVYPGLRHRMTAIEESEMFEFSTKHMEEDSYRILKGD